MTPKLKLELERSQKTQRVRALQAKDPAKLSDEERAEIVSLADRLDKIETEWRAASEAEQAETRAKGENPDAEARERDRLVAGVSIMDYLDEVLTDKRAEGKAHEARQALIGEQARERLIPFDFLLPPEPPAEARAVTPVAGTVVVANYQASVLERVFTRSVAARLMVSMPSVPVGQANFPILTGGTTAGMVAADGTHAGAAGSFEGFTLEPIRLTAHYEMRMEDIYKLRGYESVLRRDLAAVMSDQMDHQVVNGDGNAPNVSGFQTELAAPAAEANAITWSEGLGKMTALVDGLNSFDLSDIRTVIGKRSFGYYETLFRTGATDNGPRASLGDYIRAKIGGYSVSSRIAEIQAHSQINIAALTSFPGRNAVAPMWSAFEVIRDNITQASKGQIILTAIALWNFKILRETGFNLYRVRIS